MSKFFLEQIVDKETEAIALSEYNSQNEAERAYHKVFSDSLPDESTTFIRAKVINGQGGQASPDLKDVWKVTVPTPEPNEGEDPEPTPTEPTKYYFTQIRFFVNPETPINRSMQAYDTEREALEQYHKILYSLMADPSIAAITVLIEDKEGGEIHRRYWERIS